MTDPRRFIPALCGFDKSSIGFGCSKRRCENQRRDGELGEGSQDLRPGAGRLTPRGSPEQRDADLVQPNGVSVRKEVPVLAERFAVIRRERNPNRRRARCEARQEPAELPVQIAADQLTVFVAGHRVIIPRSLGHVHAVDLFADLASGRK